MKKRNLILSLSLITLLVYIGGHFFPEQLTTYYSLSINKYYIQCLSFITGLLPFSLFEVSLYLLLTIWCWCLIYRIIQVIKQKHSLKQSICAFAVHNLYFLIIILFVFLWSWGFNYQRLPLSQALALTDSSYSVEELSRVYQILISRANALREQVDEDSQGYMTIKGGYQDVFHRAGLSYDKLKEYYPIFSGTYSAAKPILASHLMNYTGITGIYSPFTAEANVNISILPQALPYTTLHEMAHQRGFCGEDECNFIAFLGCIVHPDADFNYSGYLLALAYTNTALSQSAPEVLHILNKELSPKVLADIKHNNRFWEKYDGPIESVSSKINDTYLKVNGISTGEANYGEMVDLLINFYEQNPDFFLLH